MGTPVSGQRSPQGAIEPFTTGPDPAAIPPETAQRWKAQDALIARAKKSSDSGKLHELYIRAIRDALATDSNEPIYAQRANGLLKEGISILAQEHLLDVGGTARFWPDGADVRPDYAPGLVEVFVPRGPEGDKAAEGLFDFLGASPYGVFIDSMAAGKPGPRV